MADFSDAAAFAIVFFSYFIFAKVGLFIFTEFNTSPALIWPPVGIALVAVIYRGYRMWLPILLAQFLAVVSQFGSDAWEVSLALAVAYAIQAVISLYVLRAFGFEPDLGKLRNVLTLVLVCFVVTIVEPTIATIMQYFTNTLFVSPLVNFGRTWAAGIFSTIICVSFVATWYPLRRITFTRAEVIEISSAFLLLIATNLFLFWTPYPSLVGISVIFFLPAVLVWVVLRMNVRWLTLALLTTSVVGIAGSLLAQPTETPLGAQLLSDEVYIGLVAAIFLVFAAVVEERRAVYLAVSNNNARLEVALQKLSKEDQAKSEFLAILAHELRNPLAPVLSSLELMKMKMNEENRTDMLELIETATNHNGAISHLLDDILDISRISRKEFKLHKEIVPLRPLIKSALETVDPFYRSRNHSLSITIPDDEYYIEVDRLRIQQVVINLLLNAGKYTDPGGDIDFTVEIGAARDTIRITVKDNGIGIDPSMLERIFEPFAQIPKKGAYASTGLGIGLSLSKRLVELHAGSIWALSSGEDRGSTFTVVLPVPIFDERLYEMRTIGSRSSLPEAPIEKKYSILVVDDNKDAAEGLGKLLQLSGHAVTIAYDGPTGVDKAADSKVEVVLLDIGLPGISGYEVARQIRKTRGDGLFLIALTGYGQEEDKKKAMSAGFDMHLTKPVALSDIESILAYV